MSYKVIAIVVVDLDLKREYAKEDKIFVHDQLIR
jgi:hypothetical protein